ncbi:MAG: PucR family transcriptional regulator, partial [Marmoricola sp.]|nr:PucR family transcriptional regulator [Marmoricola sp.]
QAGLRLGRTGCFDREELSWRMALVSEPEVGDSLVKRYLDPLREFGDFGDVVIESVREYLASGRHMTRAARSLHIHVNSLRHRLDRFMTITGRDLDDADVGLEVHWALERALLFSEGQAAVPIVE